MTNEQIKQNAEIYAEEHAVRIDNGGFEEEYDYKEQEDAYIAGAHSRDEEISRMQESLDECRRALFQLRNPWISVKDRLPEDGDVVITRIVHVVKGGGEHSESVQHLEQMYRGRWLTDSMEQHRRNGILYDCISEVTHWMPIPKLPKEE